MSWITDKTVGLHGGVETRYHFDPDTEKSYLSYHQDVSSILDRNAAFRADGQTDSEALGRKVAEIPADLDGMVPSEGCSCAGLHALEGEGETRVLRQVPERSRL